MRRWGVGLAIVIGTLAAAVPARADNVYVSKGVEWYGNCVNSISWLNTSNDYNWFGALVQARSPGCQGAQQSVPGSSLWIQHDLYLWRGTYWAVCINQNWASGRSGSSYVSHVYEGARVMPCGTNWPYGSYYGQYTHGYNSYFQIGPASAWSVGLAR